MKLHLKNWSRRVSCVTLITIFAGLSSAYAETVFVDDFQRVGVRAEANSTTAPIVVITTGDEVEVLQHQGKFMRIRTANNIEGWVRSRYMTTEAPAKIQLINLKAVNSNLREKLVQLQTQLNDSNALNQRISALDNENKQLQAKLASIDESNDNTWIYWLSGLLAMGPLGFLLGLLWYRYQIMKKLGGFTL